MNPLSAFTKILFLFSGALALRISAPMLSAGQTAASAQRPNVVVLMADDMGFADAGFNGCKDFSTPHLDALAGSGIRFTHGYVSGPLCGPTRAGFITGRYQQRFGHEYNPPPGGINPQEKTIGDRMKAAGYVTGVLGKWHLGEEDAFHPLNRGFDEFFGFLGGSHSYFETNDKKRGPIFRGRQPVKLEGYLTDVLAQEALSFIERHQAKPFFLYLAFNAVHTPMQAPSEVEQRFSAIANAKRRTYAAMLTKMDEAIGRVVATLHDTKLRERTIVFFCSDNGGPIASWTTQNAALNTPLSGGKTQTLEGGIHVPFLASWPGTLPAGKLDERPVIQLDILPTALGAAGAKIDPAWKLDGVNLMPYLTGQKTGLPHDALFWRHGDQWAVRQGNWKLVAYSDRERTPSLSKPALYDLSADLGERHDRSAENSALMRELRARWEEWNRSNITLSKSDLGKAR